MAVEMATYWNIIVTQGFKNHLFAWTSACGGEKFSDPWYDIWMEDFGTVLLKVLMFVPTLFHLEGVACPSIHNQCVHSQVT
jgi:hypothetical protein